MVVRCSNSVPPPDAELVALAKRLIRYAGKAAGQEEKD
jgi:hypothetical protein